MSHTFTHRLNALLTFAVTTLAALCFLASVTDEFHESNPIADVKVLEIERFTAVDRNDEAYLVFSVDADLRSCFSWNTKQLFVSVQAEYAVEDEQKGEVMNVISIWDRVVESKEKAVLRVPRARNKYKLKDRGQHLRGAHVNVTLQWNIMPITGRVRSEKRYFEGVTFPEEYFEADPSEAPGNRGGRQMGKPSAARAPKETPSETRDRRGRSDTEEL
jgi:signal peptidase complex subunit 3